MARSWLRRCKRESCLLWLAMCRHCVRFGRLHSITTFIATLHAFPLLLGLRSAAVILHDWSFEERDYSYKGKNYPFAVLYTV